MQNRKGKSARRQCLSLPQRGCAEDTERDKERAAHGGGRGGGTSPRVWRKLRRSCGGRQTPESQQIFQFTPVLRRATCGATVLSRTQSGFNSRPSCDGRRIVRGSRDLRELVSIHARLATGDDTDITATKNPKSFNSRPSCDGRHVAAVTVTFAGVSIHARLATGDSLPNHNQQFDICFNSRPSCDGRLGHVHEKGGRFRFNSRPSCDGRQRQGR